MSTLVERVIVDVAEAVSRVTDGATVMVGGFGLVGAPLTLIEGLLAHTNVGNLTVVSNNLGEPGRGLGRLLLEGRVRKAIGSYFTSNPDVVAAHQAAGAGGVDGVEPKGRSPVFVLGAYPSALHVRWTPSGAGHKPVQALAVDNEPWPFWDGDDERERVATWYAAVGREDFEWRQFATNAAYATLRDD
jgi:hypothetical protein